MKKIPFHPQQAFDLEGVPSAGQVLKFLDHLGGIHGHVDVKILIQSMDLMDSPSAFAYIHYRSGFEEDVVFSAQVGVMSAAFVHEDQSTSEMLPLMVSGHLCGALTLQIRTDTNPSQLEEVNRGWQLLKRFVMDYLEAANWTEIPNYFEGEE